MSSGDGEIAQSLSRIPAAHKMAWAANRITTREEDRAYSLIGLFGISIPLLYGEGKNAFKRLQEEIIRDSNDMTLFAWTDATLSGSGDPASRHGRGILARSPENFTATHVSGLHASTIAYNPEVSPPQERLASRGLTTA